MPPADFAALAVLCLAALRGLYLGLAREVFSVVSLASACIAVRFGASPGADWLLRATETDLDPRVATVLAGIGIAVGVLLLGAVVGRIVRRGARAVGLGWLDRGAGGVLGAAEGALVAGLALLLAAVALGRDHPFVAESQAFDAVERLEVLAREGELPSVAAPPPRLEPEGRR
jgi:membrane protein required for colicin V production